MAYEDIKNRNHLFSQAFGQPERKEIIPQADWAIDKSQNPDFAILFGLGDLQKKGIGYEQAVEQYPRLAVYMKPTGEEVKARLKEAEESTSLSLEQRNQLLNYFESDLDLLLDFRSRFGLESPVAQSMYDDMVRRFGEESTVEAIRCRQEAADQEAN